MDNTHQQRDEMVQTTLSARDIRAPEVLAAMREVPRHLFVPPEMAAQAYGDFPLAIGHQQTISQPYIVALMAQAAQIAPHHRILEIGTGCGYGAAILSRLATQVYTMEYQPTLARDAAQRLHALGFHNIFIRQGDGSLGWPEVQPFDAIVVTAAPPHTPVRLLQQLKTGGRAVIPIGKHGQQILYIIQKLEEGWLTQEILPVRFVPMLGQVQQPLATEALGPPD